eukprot:14897934-Alexandrium_andersonii.AAC.1
MTSQWCGHDSMPEWACGQRPGPSRRSSRARLQPRRSVHDVRRAALDDGAEMSVQNPPSLVRCLFDALMSLSAA